MTLVICALIPCISITSTLLNKFTAVFMKRSLDYYSKSGTASSFIFLLVFFINILITYTIMKNRNHC